MTARRSGTGPATRFGAGVTLGYAALVLPTILAAGGDPGVLIRAGDQFVTADATPAPIPVARHSDGYDGQFYYRLAVAPFSTAPVAGGVRFDGPRNRTQRILYPLLARAAALGRASLVPWTLLAINLAAVFVLAFAASRLASEAALPRFMPVAVALCPGFLVTLLHDTTELVADAFLMLALLFLGRGRAAVFGLAGAASVLAREDGAALFAGIAVGAALGPTPDRRAVTVAAGVVVATALVWHGCVALLWASAPPVLAGLGHDLGWPIAGAGRALAADLRRLMAAGTVPPHALIEDIVLLASLGGILALLLVGVSRAPGAWNRGGRLAPVAAGWLSLAGLVACYTATGPWIDPVAYERATTGLWTVGCVVIALGRPAAAATRAAACAFCVAMFLAGLAITTLRAGLLHGVLGRIAS